jgi:hypothetical protein
MNHSIPEKVSPQAVASFLRSLPPDYFTSQLPNAQDAHLLAIFAHLVGEPFEACRAYAAALDEQLDNRAKDHLTSFIFRAAMIAVRQLSVDHLRCGFIALAIMGFPRDIHELYGAFAALNRSAEHLKADPHQLFEMAARYAVEPALAQMMLDFDKQSPTYKRLETFQLREIHGPNGVIYWSPMNDTIPEGWR